MTELKTTCCCKQVAIHMRSQFPSYSFPIRGLCKADNEAAGRNRKAILRRVGDSLGDLAPSELQDAKIMEHCCHQLFEWCRHAFDCEFCALGKFEAGQLASTP
jgi:hypothetical protein